MEVVTLPSPEIPIRTENATMHLDLKRPDVTMPDMQKPDVTTPDANRTDAQATATAATPAGHEAAGFSLVEVLIAAALMLGILLGIIPLFTQAMVNNTSGRDSTTVSNYAKSQVEELYQLPFDDPNLRPAAGSTELETIRYQLDPHGEWVETTGGAEPVWKRTARLRQYSVGDLFDGTLDTPLAGDADPRSVHLRELEVQIESGRTGGPLGGGEEITVRLLKGF